MERVWRQYYAHHQEAIKDVSLYITVFYNQVSLHSTLNYLSPYQFEQNTNNLSIEVSDFSWPSHLSNILLCSMEHENLIQQSIQQLLNESH